MKPALLAILFTLVIPAVFADTVTLDNGDHITGSVVSKETGQLLFKTTYAGIIKIDWASIVELQTDKPVQIVLVNETILEQALFSANKKGIAAIKPGDAGKPLIIALDRVRYINPSPAVSGKGTKVHGRANVGIATANGNTDSKSYNLDAEVVVRRFTNRITVGGSLFKASSNNIVTEDKNTTYFKYDYFLDKKRYIYGDSSFAHDKFKDQKLKSTVGVGYGHQFIESSRQNLFIEGGINYVRDDHFNSADEKYTAGRWAIRYDQKFFKNRMQFFHTHEGLLDLGNSDNLTLISKTGFRFPLLSGMSATLQLNVEWDKSPPAGTKTTDRKMLFNVGYSW